MEKAAEVLELYLEDPRLKMTAPGRLFLRISAYSAYGLGLVAGLVFIFSDLPRLRWLGILIFLFLGDRWLHFSEADRSFPGKIGGRLNIADFLTPAASDVLIYAFERAKLAGGNFHVFLVKKLLNQPEVKETLRRLDVDPEEFSHKTDEIFLRGFSRPRPSGGELAAEAEAAARAAFMKAVLSGSRFVEPRDFFASAGFWADEDVNRLLAAFAIEPADLERALALSVLVVADRRRLGSGAAARRRRHRTMNRAWTARPTPQLDKFSADLTDAARAGQGWLLVGHEKELDRLTDVLSRPVKASALLVGEAGIGKETIVSHLAYRIVKDEVPAPLFDKRLVSLEVGALAAGAAPAEIEARVKAIIEEIISAGNVILFIPDFHNLVKTSGPMVLSAADVFLPAVAGGLFQVVGATLPKEFKEFIEPRGDLKNAFETIAVEEVTEDEAVRILIYEGAALERQSKLTVSFGAIRKAVDLARKYFHRAPLPGAAADLLREAAAHVLEKEEKIVGAESVIAVAEKRVNVPLHEAEGREAEKLLNLEAFIREKFVNQEQAVKGISRALREYRSGLTRKGGPIAGFLFVGPTGVGKTELSKILARLQFGSEEAMARFDMSEYQEKQSVFRLIGSPDGRTTGSLTDRILEKPFSLILLDELEKAHRGVINLFLQVLDDGRLTDGLGRTVDFQNAIIIATSNAHSVFVKEEIEKGRSPEAVAEELKRKLVDYFPPELLNRFSEIVVFKNLTPPEIERVARLQLAELARDLDEARSVVLTFDEAVVRKIAALGYDPVFGARPLRGVISEKLRGVLAEKILSGEIVKGSAIKAVMENDEIRFV